MSLDEIKKRIDEQRQKEEEKRKRAEEKKQQKKLKREQPDELDELEEKPRRRESKIDKQFDEEIQGTLGDLTLILTKKHINSLLHKIWELDTFETSEIDKALIGDIEKDPSQLQMKMNKQLFLDKIHQDAYFRFPDGNLMSYNTFRQDWQYYVGTDRPLQLPGRRKEFVQFLTNRFKSRWVYQDGTPLPEQDFQMLYRIEREPKALERLLDYLEEYFFSAIKKDSLNGFFRQIRMKIAKVIKDNLLNFISPQGSVEK